MDGKKQSIEPHVVRSNSIEALSTSMTKNRLLMFEVIRQIRCIFFLLGTPGMPGWCIFFLGTPGTPGTVSWLGFV